MNSQEFVELIKLVVSDSAITDTVSVLTSPPGRKPSKFLLEMSEFYNKQSFGDKACVDMIIKKSVEEAVFGFFCVLDGVRAIEDFDDRGVLSLYYEGGTTVKLNSNGDLHDIYNSK
ncbi:hypothetical protein HKK52_00185 [Pseudomonas sp. ADAK2]|uniref:hypothetical protein n=1 Tax=unclassified Pseudomonas TaxID=196821 RepID=UPI0014635662|nr:MULTISPECIES: hypothetical protein [unclassified Pseudomonas]QJI39415.1 hypothetical protein HKK53_00185 [Pseudomonas sp. ADAK7]QJI45721.1 hypothetical protein HKK52_00185 [Pseudomonas sp. ADAK2]